MNTALSWTNDFLAKRGLEKPDGKPLYAYNIKDHEYSALIELLRKGNIENERWDACFVLYACEWWRRSFPGGYWRWDPILDQVQKANKIYPIRRSEIVKNGFSFWGREVVQTEHANSYLGTIIIESGIPNFFFKEGHYISKLISKIYEELGAISSIEEEIIEFIERESKTIGIPPTLNHPQLLSLIGSMAKDLIYLQLKHNLSTESKPIEKLDADAPDWRSEFPIRLDSDEAKKFIDNLLSDIAKKDPPIFYPAIVKSRLLKTKEGEWACQSFLSVKGGIIKYKSLGLDFEDYSNASSKLELFVATTDFEGRIGFAFKIQEQEAFKVDEIESRIITLDALKSKGINLFFYDGRTGHTYDIPYRGLDIAGSEAPIVFVEDEGSWSALGVGSLKTSAPTIRIIVPADSKVNCQSIEKIGVLEPQRVLYEVSSKCMISHKENNYTICPSEEEEIFEYVFRGKDNTKFVDFFQRSNENVFIGAPKILRIKGSDGIVSKVLNGIEYYDNGNWAPFEDSIFGNFRIRIRENGDVKFSKRVSILPDDLKFYFPAGNNNSSIEIESKWAVQYTVKSKITSKITRNNGKATIAFDKASIKDKNLPDSFGLEIRCQNGKPITCVVPYPKPSCSFYDQAGTPLGKGSHINLNELFGCRLSVANLDGKPRKERIRLSLVAPRSPELSVELNWSIRIDAYEQKRLPLTTFKPQILKLFSLTSDIDSYVMLKILGESNQYIKVGQFPAGRPEFNGTELKLPNISGETRNNICAFRFDIPFSVDNIKELPYDNHTGSWRLPDEKGIWLVYPGADSSGFFRPVAFSNAEKYETEGGPELHHASTLSNEKRFEEISRIFDLMCQDYNHPDWPRLIKLFDTTNHLPLAVMDYWKVISRHRRALIAAFFKFPKNLVVQISEEFSVAWLEYPIAEWKEAFDNFIKGLPDCDDDLKETIIKHTLERFENLLEISAHRLILNNELETIPEIALKSIILQALNGEENQPGLRARHHQNWPTHSDIIVSEFIKLPKEVRHLLPRDIPRFQQQVVYLPFVLAATAVGIISPVSFKEENPLNRFKIIELIEFDERWFKEVYNLLVGYLWNQAS